MKIRATSHPSGLQGFNLEFGVCNQWNFGLACPASSELGAR